MAKDPAVLFYYQDFLFGTSFMSNEDVGKYIRILCFLADKGSITEKQVLSICKASVIPENIHEKLERDSDGNYYQHRMREEQEKRRRFSDSRRKNALGEKAYAEHMEDENENRNEDINIIKDIQNQWNQFASQSGLSSVIKLSKKRESGIRSRLSEQEFDLQKIFNEIKQSDFLRGSTGWRVDFDFVFCSTNNYLKILEGKYQNNGKPQNINRQTDASKRAEYRNDPERLKSIAATVEQRYRKRDKPS